MAGGKGTRVLALTNDEIPKPMLSICGKPILEHQIDVLKKHGITDITLVVGHRSSAISNYFLDGAGFGVSIEYIEEELPLGTAGALYYLRNRVHDDFFLVYGDIIYDIDMTKMLEFHRQKHSVVTLFVHPNSHPYDSDLVVLDSNDRVVRLDSKTNTRNYYFDNYVNAGIFLLSPDVLPYVSEPTSTDLERDVITRLIHSSKVFGYRSPEYVRDLGTPERIRDAESDIMTGIVTSRNLSLPQKCIFVDRDGTLNQYRDFIYHESQFQLEEGTLDAVRAINQSKYLCIVVTNQPVVARGLCTVDDVDQIHRKMKTLLGNQGAYLDDVLYCPHHPDLGYPEENRVYKIDCKCRKPKTGMLQLAAQMYNIDLSQSWIIGDTTVDIQTGIAAGMKTVLVQTGQRGMDGKYDVKPDITSRNLFEAVQTIIQLS
ncbi:HAD-IIIA family hydrolase [Alicyclobacillus mengziensis]|uniref:HAD-IIIA family hydrolase n=1 Tax=Alicyclobacillus mengziensis TaxID=2931921 RepID=A0A9X7VZ78_9BACL|nr:HAD-IIIA family hydrolase [Alicyclobacillus mengziensis]QSO47530.1 HAD-IIIA family hydrolase [Alicyclobacillus mengziensis]